jgi:hypothetical protein
MADQQSQSKREPDQRRVSGISAAALEGAREGEASPPDKSRPDDNAAKLAAPPRG